MSVWTPLRIWSWSGGFLGVSRIPKSEAGVTLPAMREGTRIAEVNDMWNRRGASECSLLNVVRG